MDTNKHSQQLSPTNSRTPACTRCAGIAKAHGDGSGLIISSGSAPSLIVSPGEHSADTAYYNGAFRPISAPYNEPDKTTWVKFIAQVVSRIGLRALIGSAHGCECSMKWWWWWFRYGGSYSDEERREARKELKAWTIVPSGDGAKQNKGMSKWQKKWAKVKGAKGEGDAGRYADVIEITQPGKKPKYDTGKVEKTLKSPSGDKENKKSPCCQIEDMLKAGNGILIGVEFPGTHDNSLIVVGVKGCPPKDKKCRLILLDQDENAYEVEWKEGKRQMTVIKPTSYGTDRGGIPPADPATYSSGDKLVINSISIHK